MKFRTFDFVNMDLDRRNIPVLCVVVLCVVNVIVKADEMRSHHHLKHCSRVHEEYVRRKIGTTRLVPNKPVHDANISICFDGTQDKNRKSCCTRKTELKYSESAEKYLRDSVRSSNAFLKKFIMDSLAEYQERILDILEESQNRTSVLLTKVHSIPWAEHHGTVSDLYLDLEQFARRQPVSIHDTVNAFFTELFPAVFYYALSDPKYVQKYNDNYRRCLIQNQEEIQPFGNVPHHLAHKIHQAFQRARSFVNALSIVVEAINTTDHILVEEDCRHAVTRMQYCSHCDGYVDARPCHGFCFNVMRGCLAKVSEITPEWDELVDSVDVLARAMKTKYNLEEVLLSIEGSVNDAILQAMDDGPRIYNKVRLSCKNMTSRSDSDGPYRKSQGIMTSAPYRQKTSHTLSNQVENVLKNLRDAKGVFNRLADRICGQSGLYEQDMSSSRCWNGTAIAEYMYVVPASNFISQAKENREVKVSLIADYKLLQTKEKLMHMRKNLSTLVTDDLMFADRPDRHQVYGSGDGSRVRDVIIDDEDLYGGESGSGSGDSSYTVQPSDPGTDTKINHDISLDKKTESAGSQVYPGQVAPLVVLFTFVTTTTLLH